MRVVGSCRKLCSAEADNCSAERWVADTLLTGGGVWIRVSEFRKISFKFEIYNSILSYQIFSVNRTSYYHCDCNAIEVMN